MLEDLLCVSTDEILWFAIRLKFRARNLCHSYDGRGGIPLRLSKAHKDLYGEVNLHDFQTSALDGESMLSLRFDCFTPEEGANNIHRYKARGVNHSIHSGT